MKWVKIYKYYLIYSLTLTGMLGFVSVFLIYPALHKIIAIKQEISQEKSDLESKLNMGLNAKRIKEELEGIEGSLQNLDTVFIKPGEELSLLSGLENLAAKHQIKLAIKPDFNGQSMGGGIIRIPLELKASGSFNNLISFANDLDVLPFYFITDSFLLKKIDDNSLEFSLNGQVYLKNGDNKTKN